MGIESLVTVAALAGLSGGNKTPASNDLTVGFKPIEGLKPGDQVIYGGAAALKFPKKGDVGTVYRFSTLPLRKWSVDRLSGSSISLCFQWMRMAIFLNTGSIPVISNSKKPNFSPEIPAAFALPGFLLSVFNPAYLYMYAFRHLQKL
jgi:hypothetical protein